MESFPCTLRYVFALGTQKFTEDKSRGAFGSYSRSAHADFSEVVFDSAYKMLTKRGVPEKEAGMFLRTSRTYAVRQSAYWGSFLTLTYELPTGYPGISFRSGSNSVAFTVTSPDQP